MPKYPYIYILLFFLSQAEIVVRIKPLQNLNNHLPEIPPPSFAINKIITSLLHLWKITPYGFLKIIITSRHLVCVCV